MALVQTIALLPPRTWRATRWAIALLVLAALAYGAVAISSTSTHAGRCQDLLQNTHRSDYISFEIEGCGASGGGQRTD